MVKPELIDGDPNIRKLMEEAAGLTAGPVEIPAPRKLTECKVRLWKGNPKPQIHWGYNERTPCNYSDSGHTQLFNWIKSEVQADLLESHITDLKMQSYRSEDTKCAWQVLVVRWNGTVKRIHVLAYDRWYGSLVQPVQKWDRPFRAIQKYPGTENNYWDYNIKDMIDVK